jgi:putative hydrolase of the HAD superfamily
MIKAIFLDMDDTLVVNSVFYARAEVLLYGYLRHCGILEKDAKKVFTEIDKELYKIHGVSKKRMPASFEAVLRHFVPDADAEMVTVVRGFAEEIFTAKAAMKPGTIEAIELLRQHGYDLYIVTAGDRDVQEGRIASSVPFSKDLSGVFIVDQKTRETYEEILRQLGLNPAETVMIGDSLKSDVFPAAAAGMFAVWIEAQNYAAHHETATGFPAQGAAKFSSLLEAARHIVKHGTPAAPIVLPPPAPKNEKNIQPPKP